MFLQWLINQYEQGLKMMYLLLLMNFKMYFFHYFNFHMEYWDVLRNSPNEPLELMDWTKVHT